MNQLNWKEKRKEEVEEISFYSMTIFFDFVLIVLWIVSLYTLEWVAEQFKIHGVHEMAAKAVQIGSSISITIILFSFIVVKTSSVLFDAYDKFMSGLDAVKRRHRMRNQEAGRASLSPMPGVPREAAIPKDDQQQTLHVQEPNQ
jgi:hypothetical protein